jgi:GGDEF domain-containing protein
MNKRFSWIFLLASGAFFVFIVGLTGYRIEHARRLNAATARERMTELAAKAQSLRDTTGGYDAPQFKTDMHEVFDAEPRLLLLSISTQQDGILYLVTRNKAYLKEPSAIGPSWRGRPTYQVSRGYEVLLSRTLKDAGNASTLDALFVIMGREDLYPVVRDDLFLFLAFLLVCGVVILIATNVQQDAADAAARQRPVSPAPSAAPEPELSAPGHHPGPESHPDSARALTSPRTGLVWADYLEPRLRAELSRAAASDLDIALAKIRIDEPFADAKLPIVHASIAGILKESFPLHDLMFESGNDSYALLLPDTDVDSAVRNLDAFRTTVAGAAVEGRMRSVSIGVSSRGGRLIDESTLLEEADISLAKASREGGNQVIGFRADPSRFRDTLAGTRI